MKENELHWLKIALKPKMYRRRQNRCFLCFFLPEVSKVGPIQKWLPVPAICGHGGGTGGEGGNREES